MRALRHSLFFQAAGRAAAAAVLALCLLSVPTMAHAQAQGTQQPIITGTQQSSMDAPETNNELEEYEHAPMVAKVGHVFGLSPQQSSRWFEDFNSGVLIAVILFVLFRVLPAKFRTKRETIARELVEARKATEEAQARLAQIENRLAALGKDVDELRRHAAEVGEHDEARIKATMEEERERIIRSAESEIAAAQASAERGLKRFASDLAVERAAARVELTPEGDQALTDEFLQGLAARFQRGGGRN